MPDIINYVVTMNSNASFGSDLRDKDFKHQQFTDFSGHNKKITNCDFSYTVFQRAYFRKVIFENCDFTGAKFIDSNLRDAEFINCKFPYAIFKFTLIRYTEVVKNLPEWPNVRIILLQNHKANANSFGDSKSSRLYLRLEIESSKEHLRSARKKNDGYYKTKYGGFWRSAEVFWKNFVIYIDDLLWGHGESPWKIARNAALFILMIAIIQTLRLPEMTKISFWELRESFISFIWSDFKVFVGVPADQVSDKFKVALILLRYLTLGLFIRVLFNRFSWR